jgi:hypothetical protein
VKTAGRVLDLHRSASCIDSRCSSAVRQKSWRATGGTTWAELGAAMDARSEIAIVEAVLLGETIELAVAFI